MYILQKKNATVGVRDISEVSEVTFLGIKVDSELSWSSHVDEVCAHLSKSFYALKQLKDELPHEALMQTYYALVHPRLAYGVIMWGSAPSADRVLLLQKRIIRMIFGVDYRESCRPLFASSGIMTLTNIYIYKACLFVFSNKTQFIKNCDTHAYETRNSSMIRAEKHRMALYEKSPKCASGRIYNKLPHSLKESHNISEFKRNIKKYLKDRPYYNVNEFLSSV